MRKPFDEEYPITQIFGVNPQMYAQFGYKGHNGIDYGLPNWTPVLAPHSGKIIEAALDSSGYGLYVKIENDIEGSVLGHFAELRVGVGDIVTEGQLVAYSDNSGNSTGPHLHWGYYRIPRDRQNGYGGFIDQTSYIGVTNSSTIPMNNDSNKATQVDAVLNYLKEQGYITDSASEKYRDGKFTELINMRLYADYVSQRGRAGAWDIICGFLGYTDSTTVTAQQVIDKITPWKTAGNSLASLTQEKNTLAVQLGECQTQAKVWKEEYDNTNAPTGYKAQIKSLENDKKSWIEKEQNYIKQVKTLQTKYDNVKKPFKDILSAIFDKLNNCIKT